MSKKTNDAIANSDIGKTVSNGATEIGNYNTFAITLKATERGTNPTVFYTTIIYSRDSGGNKFGSFYKTLSSGNNNNRYYAGWTVSLSNTTFSVSCTGYNQFYQGKGADLTASIQQIRVLG